VCALFCPTIDTEELAGGARERGGGMTHLYLFITEEMIVDSMESPRKKRQIKRIINELNQEIAE
jgi:hypothetical protein